MRWLLIACVLASAPSRADEPDGPDDEHHGAEPYVAPQQNYAPPPQNYVAPQQYSPPAPLPGRDEIDRLERTGKSMKAGGGAMIAFGAAAELTGLILVLYTQLAPNETCGPVVGGQRQCTTSLDVGLLVGGMAAGVAGAGLLYGGMAVLSAGGARVRRAQVLRARLGLSIGMNAAGLRFATEF